MTGTGNIEPFVAEYRVIYGDTDSMGIAYYANYFRWFEMARSEMFRSLGLPYSVVEKKGVFLPVSEAKCKYVAPVRYDEVIRIETTVDASFRAGIKFDYRIVEKESKKLIAEGFTRHACMDGNGKVIRPPVFLKQMIDKPPAS